MPNPNVQLDQIAQTFPSMEHPKARTFLERRGMNAMTILLWFICVSAVLVILIWWCTQPNWEDAANSVRPKTEDLQPLTAEQTESAIAVLKAMRDSHFQALRELFQITIISGLVPLFTLMAGYLFGKGELVTKKKDDEPEG